MEVGVEAVVVNYCNDDDVQTSDASFLTLTETKTQIINTLCSHY